MATIIKSGEYISRTNRIANVNYINLVYTIPHRSADLGTALTRSNLE